MRRDAGSGCVQVMQWTTRRLHAVVGESPSVRWDSAVHALRCGFADLVGGVFPCRPTLLVGGVAQNRGQTLGAAFWRPIVLGGWRSGEEAIGEGRFG